MPANKRLAIRVYHKIFCLFIERKLCMVKSARLSWAMVINGQWNKPIGPGGGTRRLHHKMMESHLLKWQMRSFYDGGETGSTRA